MVETCTGGYIGARNAGVPFALTDDQGNDTIPEGGFFQRAQIHFAIGQTF